MRRQHAPSWARHVNIILKYGGERSHTEAVGGDGHSETLYFLNYSATSPLTMTEVAMEAGPTDITEFLF